MNPLWPFVLLGILLAAAPPAAAWLFRTALEPLVRRLIEVNKALAPTLPTGPFVRMTTDRLTAIALSMLLSLPGFGLTLAAEPLGLHFDMATALLLGTIAGAFLAIPVNLATVRRLMERDRQAAGSPGSGQTAGEGDRRAPWPTTLLFVVVGGGLMLWLANNLGGKSDYALRFRNDAQEAAVVVPTMEGQGEPPRYNDGDRRLEPGAERALRLFDRHRGMRGYQYLLGARRASVPPYDLRGVRYLTLTHEELARLEESQTPIRIVRGLQGELALEIAAGELTGTPPEEAR